MQLAEDERHLLAAFAVEAADKLAAKRLVLDRHRDSRLDSAECKPVFRYGPEVRWLIILTGGMFAANLYPAGRKVRSS